MPRACDTEGDEFGHSRLYEILGRQLDIMVGLVGRPVPFVPNVTHSRILPIRHAAGLGRPDSHHGAIDERARVI